MQTPTPPPPLPNMIPTRPKTLLKLAIFWMVMAALFNASTSAVAKYCSNFLTINTIIFSRSFLGLILMTLWILFTSTKQPVLHKFSTSDKNMHLVRGFLALFSLYLFFYSLRYLDLADALVLSNTMPIFIPFVLYFWKKVPIEHKLWWGIGLSFCGVVIMMQPGSGVFQWVALLTVLGAMIGSIQTTALRFSHYNEKISITLFYYFLITGVATGIFSFFPFSLNWGNMGWPMLGWMGLLGLTGFGWQLCFTLGTRCAPIRVTTPILYFSVLFGMLYDWWIWQRGMTILEGIGFFCILCGAYLVAYFFPRDKI